MTSVGLGLFVVLIVTAVTSGKGNAMTLKAEVSRIRLLMYIALRGFQFGYEVDSMRVHDPCVGADFECSLQYCSCIISLCTLMNWGRLGCCSFWLVFSEGCTAGLRRYCCCWFQSLVGIGCGLSHFL